MKVCIGGTFNILHAGHELLFKKAFEGHNYVHIGLTSDELAREEKDVKVFEYQIRMDNLNAFLNSKGWDGRYSIVRLDDELGPATWKDFDAIVVSEETRLGAENINLVRKENDLPPLKILTVPLAYAENGDVISATRIKRGEMDVNGKMMRQIVVCVGSENQVKINATEIVFSKLFRRVQVKGMKVKVNVPEQPKEKEVMEGAVARAKSALTKGCDFGVGIEAGLFYNDFAKEYFDVQYCAIIDKANRVTLGHGSGFYYPSILIELVNQGKTIGQAVEEEFKIEDVGQKKGAIGFLSKGLIDRTKLTEQAVLMAAIPRIRSEIYERY
jgi:inosine/xanthosine triphosphatase